MRCLLVDDNGAFIETACLLLAREGVIVAGTASSIAEALRQVSALRPDVVLVDIALGDENGFDLARRLAGGGTEADEAGRRLPGQGRTVGRGDQADPRPGVTVSMRGWA